MRRTCRAVAFLMLAACAHAAAPARANVINVASFGAVPDDNINDASAISNAIASAAPGDTVQLNGGIYDLASTLSITKSNLTFTGTGAASTTLRRTGTASSDVMS